MLNILYWSIQVQSFHSELLHFLFYFCVFAFCLCVFNYENLVLAHLTIDNETLVLEVQ